MALDSVENWQKSKQYAENPLVTGLKKWGIDAQLKNEDLKRKKSIYEIDLEIKTPYHILLEAKLEETTQKNARFMSGIESKDCLRIDMADIIRYIKESEENELPVWIAVRTRKEYSPGWYFIPLFIFNLGCNGGIEGSIMPYPGKNFYCIDKRRCLDRKSFIQYVKGTDGYRRIIDNKILRNFCNLKFKESDKIIS